MEFTKISEEISSKGKEELAGLVANHLANVKFLLVMDDVWAPADWEKLQIALPTSKKDKVLITSRLVLEVFGKPEFPDELCFEGTEIAKRCGGLPLAIVIIGGILVKKFSANGDMGVIRRASQKVTENFEIPVWKLIRMWIAEGLIQRRDNISLKEIADSYLDDLINRNLVRAEKLKTDGKVKTCRVHDLLRDFCRREAGNEGDNFFQEVKMSSDGGFQPPVYEGYKCRRLCIHSEVSRFLMEKPKGPTVRSFVCFSKDEVPIQPDSCQF
ncbi:hypothetical protein SASPL_126432 [Salvia splendens]|uniref:NB-ARC domain-containing protein n=1 Tax=Salvia splendens TaxID=180675 RepID=A0A8X8XKT3_SALSN|nr:hypothetical protein SASPL_126432 [Salvia splendens]